MTDERFLKLYLPTVAARDDIADLPFSTDIGEFVEVGRILAGDMALNERQIDVVIARPDFESKTRLFRLGDYALNRAQMLELIGYLSDALLEDLEVNCGND